MKRLLTIVAAVAVVGLAAAAVGGAATSAQEGDGPIGTFLGKVADELGVSEDELKTAIRDARVETIDEAVADGRLTEEQGEKLKERAAEGGRLFPRVREGHGVCQRAAGFTVDAASEVLGMPREELVEELRSGNSVAEVAEAQGMSVDDFKVELLDEVRARLDELVAQGELTEDQASEKFEDIEEHTDRIVNAHGGPHGIRPIRHGPPHDGAESSETSEAPIA
jgi:polyhydroxyalkanoate synthesis regulator phasin